MNEKNMEELLLVAPGGLADDGMEKIEKKEEEEE